MKLSQAELANLIAENDQREAGIRDVLAKMSDCTLALFIGHAIAMAQTARRRNDPFDMLTAACITSAAVRALEAIAKEASE